MATIHLQLKTSLCQILSDLGLEITVEEIKLETPQREFGDISTNVAMLCAGKLQQNPRELATAIVEKLKPMLSTTEVTDIQIAGPGFINIKLTNGYYIGQLDSTLNFSQVESPQRIMVEFGHPNTHKMPHIGHLYSYIVGDSLSRILETVGHKVLRVNYQGDVGPHVAKCIYGWRLKGKPIPEKLMDKVRLLQTCYQEGSSLYEIPEHKEKIQEINKQVYKPDSDVQADWQITRQWSIDYYREFEQLLGINQQQHYLESQIWELGLETVKALTDAGKIFRNSEGAVVFPGEEFGLHTRVFITKMGTPTYECKEVGLNQKKMQDWPYDLTIIPTASEQNDYFNVVIAAINEGLPELKGKIEHIGFGMVGLTSGKMSSRSGNILSGPDLLAEVRSRVDEILATRAELTPTEKDLIAHKISMGAIKYTFLRGNIMQNMTFNLEESVSFDGNSGPYLQYTYARIQSVLRQSVTSGQINSSLLTKPEEIDLIKQLLTLPDTVNTAAKNRSPHLIASYSFELAQKFNSYYKLHSINGADTPELIATRRHLCSLVAQSLQTALSLLGIETVDKM